MQLMDDKRPFDFTSCIIVQLMEIDVEGNFS